MSAQLNLAASYVKGEGVEQDLSEGTEWLCKAAEQGHTGALAALKNFEGSDCEADAA